MAGRGFGKTRTGAEWVIERERLGARSLAVAGRTAADVRDVMVEGESGILRCAPPWNVPLYEPSKRRLTWKSGAVATTYSADEPDTLRGPNTDTIWGDELAAWQYSDAWTQLTLVLRSIASGLRPQAIITTTPRPTALVRKVFDDPTTVVTRGSTYDNAQNLAPSFLEKLRRLYEGTRLGRQELYAEILLDASGALWRRDQIDADRVEGVRGRGITRIVIAIDPAVTSGEDSDETGIVVAGLGADKHGYVLADYSGKYTPNQWAKLVAWLYQEYEANEVIAETNNGGDLVEANLRAAKHDLPFKKIHAKHGKRTRAEPVATLYEQRRVHHVGALRSPGDDEAGRLETQLCTWEPESVEGGKHSKQASPDRLDALVYALTDLMVDTGPPPPLPDYDPYGGDP